VKCFKPESAKGWCIRDARGAQGNLSPAGFHVGIHAKIVQQENNFENHKIDFSNIKMIDANLTIGVYYFIKKITYQTIFKFLKGVFSLNLLHLSGNVTRKE